MNNAATQHYRVVRTGFDIGTGYHVIATDGARVSPTFRTQDDARAWLEAFTS